MDEDENKMSIIPILGAALLLIGVFVLLAMDIDKHANLPNYIVVKQKASLVPTSLPITTEENSYKNEFAKQNLSEDKTIVIFNPNSLKYHRQSCKSVKKCKNCIKITKDKAIKKGGTPCKICSHKNDT